MSSFVIQVYRQVFYVLYHNLIHKFLCVHCNTQVLDNVRHCAVWFSYAFFIDSSMEDNSWVKDLTHCSILFSLGTFGAFGFLMMYPHSLMIHIVAGLVNKDDKSY